MTKMSDRAYFALDALNCSGLKDFAKSPYHFWYKHLNPDRAPEEPSKALRLGSAVHVRTLEGLKAFDEAYARAVKFDRRTTAGKEGYAAFEAANKDKTILDPDEWEEVVNISSAVLKSELASSLVEGRNGYSEEVIQCLHPEAGILMKAKMDRIQTIGGETWIVDLKTTRDASPSDFMKSCANFKYHWQAAFYMDVLSWSGDFGQPVGFAFVVVEKQPPYGVSVFQASEQFLQIGRDQYREAMDRFMVCKEQNEWPGLDQSIQSLDLPRWAL